MSHVCPRALGPTGRFCTPRGLDRQEPGEITEDTAASRVLGGEAGDRQFLAVAEIGQGDVAAVALRHYARNP